MNRRLALIIVGIIAIGVVILILMHLNGGARLSKDNKISASPSAALVAQARDLEAKGNLQEARAIYQRLVGDYPNASEIMSWQKKTEDLNIKLLFSPVITPKSALYEIKPGDTLFKIAKEHKTTVELIQKSNRISGDKIIPGKKIKVYTVPFSILVDKSQNLLILKSEEEVVKTYSVATGTNNSTPTGNFKITNRLINPTWFKAGAVVPAGSPENVLGTRWLGFDLTGYGIHGTTDPQNIGKQATQGCVRMLNAEVEELYDIIPVGTLVTIVD